MISAIQRFNISENPPPSPSPQKASVEMPAKIAPEKPQIQTPQGPGIAPLEKITTGWVSLDIQPWARIQEILDESGNPVKLSQVLTPCRIELPTGKYRLTASHPDFQPAVLEFVVKENMTIIVSKRLTGFDYGKAVESLVSQ